MPQFLIPYKRGVNKFMVQCYLTYDNLVSQEETYKEFQAITILSLRKMIKDYCRAYGFLISKMSDVYVVHEETTFKKVDGLTLKDNDMKGVWLA